MPSIEIVTTWYNEAFLAPLFLNHYAYVDQITLLYDADTTDSTLDIVKYYGNVRIVPFRFPDMMDDEIKAALINEHYRKSTCDYVLAVDADEFVFLKNEDRFVYNIKSFIHENRLSDVFFVNFRQIYRHVDDVDIIPCLPAVPQRRHGDPNMTEGVNRMYKKPCLVRACLPVEFGPGCHELFSYDFQPKISPEALLGAHWSMADPVFAYERRIKNRSARQSAHNLEKKLTEHQHHLTEEQIANEFRQHQHDPILF